MAHKSGTSCFCFRFQVEQVFHLLMVRWSCLTKLLWRKETSNHSVLMLNMKGTIHFQSILLPEKLQQTSHSALTTSYMWQDDLNCPMAFAGPFRGCGGALVFGGYTPAFLWSLWDGKKHHWSRASPEGMRKCREALCNQRDRFWCDLVAQNYICLIPLYFPGNVWIEFHL